MTYTVSKLIEMTRASAEGDFDCKFQQLFQGGLGELAPCLGAVRQTLQSLSSMTDISCSVLPDGVAGIAAIRQESQTGFNSLWHGVEIMRDDQAAVRSILAQGDHLAGDEVARLREIATKDQQTLLSLISYLTFQAVLSQRLEKLPSLIESLELKTIDLATKFNVSSNKKLVEENGATALATRGDLDQKLVDQLLENLR